LVTRLFLVQKSLGSRPSETTKIKIKNKVMAKNKIPKPQQKQELPDAKLHQQISFLKSGIRLLGYGALWFSLDTAIILLILSEVVGIKEELV
jgi:hypothetical protein